MREDDLDLLGTSTRRPGGQRPVSSQALLTSYRAHDSTAVNNARRERVDRTRRAQDAKRLTRKPEDY
jgi:hypothetical protein